mmetsp:Transcript_26725/g.58356  ORF Transcript_26725/g.58356 Transcript_26725/m.58356 type:complete len:379 (+) Transcript_26725:445-1581(+)
MGSKHVERVVRNLAAQHDHDHLDTVRADRAHDANDGGSTHVDQAACRRDGHQATHNAHGKAGNLEGLAKQLIKQDPGQHGRRRGHIGVQESMCGKLVASQRGATVEAKPAKPQQGSTQDRVGHIGRALHLSLTGAHEESRSQRTPARRHVHNHTASKVQHAILVDQTTVPDHERNRAVDSHVPHGDEQHQRREVDTVSNRAHQDGRSNDGKHALEDEQSGHGITTSITGVHVVHQAIRARGANHIRVASRVTKGQRERHQRPEDRDDGHADDHSRNGRNHVLVANHSTIEESQARRHKQHQRRAEQQPRDAGTVKVASSILSTQELLAGGCHSHGHSQAKQGRQHETNHNLLQERAGLLQQPGGQASSERHLGRCGSR